MRTALPYLENILIYVVMAGCWITEDYLPERITAAYLWMWITFFSLIILYFFMFLVMRGIVTMKRDKDENEATGQGEEEESLSKRVAYLMLL